MHQKNIIQSGQPLNPQNKVLILLHGRGGNAEDMLQLSGHLPVDDFTLLAPQATQYTWYPYSFMVPPAQNEPGLSSALTVLAELVEDLQAKGIPTENIYVAGFSQGACLTLEFVTRNARHYGGVLAFTGGLIGDKIYSENYQGDFKDTPVFISTGDPDAHVPLERVNESVKILEKMNARVELKVFPGRPHTITAEELKLAADWVFHQQQA